MCACAYTTAHIEDIGQPMGSSHLLPCRSQRSNLAYQAQWQVPLLREPAWECISTSLSKYAFEAGTVTCLSALPDAKDAVRGKEEPGLRLSFWCPSLTPWRKPAMMRSLVLAQCIHSVSPFRRQKLTGYFASVVNCEGHHIEKQRY